MSPARSKSASRPPAAAKHVPAVAAKTKAAKPAPAKIVLPATRSASEHLAGVDADWAALVARVGPFELPLHESREPYEALVKAIAH